MSLKQMLNEAIGRPVLYHFCTVSSLNFILSQNKIAPNYWHWVSLTRKHDLKIQQLSQRYCRLTLDRNRLKDFYTITPYMDGGHHGKDNLPRDVTKWDNSDRDTVRLFRNTYGTEEEERVNKSINRVNRFLIQIDIKMDIDNYDKMSRVQYANLNDEIIPDYIKDSRYSNAPIKFVDKWEPVKL